MEAEAETQSIEETNELAQNIQDFIALHGNMVDADGNILAAAVDGTDGHGVHSQETQEYQEVAYADGEQLTQVVEYQQHDLEQYQIEGQQEYNEQETQQYVEGVEGEGQEFHQQETQVYAEGQEYQEQEGQEYQHIEGEEHQGQEYHVEGQEQETQEYHHVEGQEQETQVYQHVEGDEQQAEYHVEGQEQGYQIQMHDGQAYHVITSDGQEYQGQEQIYEGQETIEFHQGEGMVEQVEGGEQHQGETQMLDENAIHEFISFHSVDADGNIIANVDGVQMEGVPAATGEENNVEIVDHNQEQQYVETAEGVEVNEQQQEHVEFSLPNDNSSALQIQEAIFNPNTGTLEPMTSAVSTSANTVTTAKGKAGTPARTVKRAPPSRTGQKKGRVQNSHVKFLVAGEGGQQIMLDAKTLQGLLQQGGGNTITLSGAAGKQQSIMLGPSSSTPQKRVIATSGRSPAKILPAPIPVGDQQQISSNSSPKPRYMLKQGNVLTPISAAMGQSLGNLGATKLLQIPGTGNQVQYVRVVSNKPIPSNKLPIAPSRPKPVAPKPQPGGQTIFSLPSGTSDIQGSGMGNFVVLPSNYMVKSESNSIPVPIRPADFSTSTSSYNGVLDSSSSSILGGFGQNLGGQSSSGNYESFRSLLEPNGMRPRKPCNCTKSQCLKLYCDCFANGEFCHLCNCNNCFNNLNHEEERQKAIKLVLERNPSAFRPKIGKSSTTGEAHERRHNKGCNCRRSGCLKNYCECYEAKIFCSAICKCNGCKNCIENIPSGLPNDVGVEQHFAGAGTSHRQTLKDLAEAAKVRVQQQTQVRNKMKAQMQDVSPQNNLGNMVPPVIFRYPNGSISYEVITSIVELLLAKSEAGQKQRLIEGDLEKLVLEEFGDCLASVMELGTTIGHLDD